MAFQSEKQKKFLARFAKKLPAKEELKSNSEHTKEEIERPKFFKTMSKLKGKK